MRGGGTKPLRQPQRDLPARNRRAATVDEDAVRPVTELDRQCRGAAIACVAGDRRGCGIELEHRLARIDPLVAPLARIAQRTGSHAGRLDEPLDPRGGQGAGALPVADAAIAMQQVEQGRHQDCQDRVDLCWRIAAHGRVAGLDAHQQFDRLDLAQRAARQHAAIVAHQIADGADQPGLAKQASGVPVGQQQTGGGDACPARNFAQLVLRAGNVAVEPAGGVGHGVQHTRALRLVRARQQQRRVDQHRQQAMTGVADIPGRAGIGPRIGGHPQRQHALGHRGALLARGAGVEIGEPAKAMDHALERGRQARAGELDVGARRHDAMEQEGSGAQRGAGRTIARQRVGDRGGQARARSLAQGVERAGGQPQPIGKPGQPLARAHGRRREIADHQRASRVGGFDFGEVGCRRGVGKRGGQVGRLARRQGARIGAVGTGRSALASARGPGIHETRLRHPVSPAPSRRQCWRHSALRRP